MPAPQDCTNCPACPLAGQADSNPVRREDPCEKRVSLSVAPLLGATLTCWAQDTANIVGIALDTSGVVIRGTKITVTNAGRGFVRHLGSGVARGYSVGATAVGNYTFHCGKERLK